MATTVAFRPACWGPSFVTPAFSGNDCCPPAPVVGVAVDDALLVKTAASGEPAGMPKSSGHSNHNIAKSLMR